MKVTIGRYYKSFASLQGALGCLPFLPPVLKAFLSDSSGIAEYLFPPLGDSQQVVFAGTVGLLLFTTFVVFTCCRLAQTVRASVPAILMFGSTLGVVVLIALYVPYVRSVAVPSVHLEVPVSIGYQRTDFALQTYPQWDDWEMLHDRGPWEEQIQKLWTTRSIIVVRLLLWASYTLSLVCMLSCVSLAVYQHASEEPPPKPKSVYPDH
jgi:hypothetical protein